MSMSMFRGTDFPFQKIGFSASENLQFHINMVEKWKFRFPIEIVHTKYWKFRLHRDVCYKYIHVRGFYVFYCFSLLKCGFP